jgi:hypothetical protein
VPETYEESVDEPYRSYPDDKKKNPKKQKLEKAVK